MLRSTLVLLFVALLTGEASAARGASDGGGAYRTDVLFLAYLPPERAVMLWERVLGAAGEAHVSVGRADTVVAYDTPPRLARFRALLTALDTPGAAAERLYLRPVVHLPPSALAALLHEALDDPRAPLVLVPDDRTGQLLVRATPARYATLDRLARRLDVPAGDRAPAIRPLPAPETP